MLGTLVIELASIVVGEQKILVNEATALCHTA